MKELFIKKFIHNYLLFRLSFGIVGVLFSYTSLEFIPLRFGHLELNETIIYGIHYLWLLSNFLIIIFNSKINDFFHFLLSTLILNKFILTPIGFSVEHLLFLLISFYNLLLVKKTNKKLNDYNRKVIFLLFMNLGVIFLFASIWKINDPLWFEGNGFRSALELNWLRVKSATFLLDFPIFLKALNYIAIFFQLTFLFGTLVNNIVFRKIYFLGLSSFFLGLIFPMHLSFIGEVGFSYIILYTYIIKFDSKIFFYDKKFKYVFFHFFLVAITLSIFNITRNSINSPSFIKPKTLNTQEDIGYFKKGLKFLKNLNISLFWIDTKMGLFNRWHNIGIYCFRVYVDDQLQYEIFDEELYSSKFNFMYPRHYQATMYFITDLIHKINYYDNYKLTDFEKITLNNLIYQNTKKINHYNQIKIKVKKSMTKLEKGNNYWEDFILIDENEIKFSRVKNTFQFQSRFREFENYFNGKNY